MPVHKAPARLIAADGTLIGEGRAFLHLRLGPGAPQPTQGTVSLDWWDDAAPAPARLALQGGPTLTLAVESDRLSGCVVGRILRYQTEWPGLPPGT